MKTFHDVRYLLGWLWALACVRDASSYASVSLLPRFGLRHCLQQPSAAALGLSTDAAVDGATSSDTNATLTLRAEYSFQTDPAPISTPEKVEEFFRKAENRDCLVSGGRRQVEVVDSTSDLMQKWRSQAGLVGAAEPELDDVLLSIQTGGIDMPGIKIMSSTIIGSKLVPNGDPTEFPFYEFVSVDDKTEATGLKPVVLIFNQLTGLGRDKREGDRTTALSLSRVTVQPSDGDEDTFRFNIDSYLEVQVNFPSFLLRILPVSKEKAEAQGAEAFKKFLQRDIDKSMSLLYESYCKSFGSG